MMRHLSVASHPLCILLPYVCSQFQSLQCLSVSFCFCFSTTAFVIHCLPVYLRNFLSVCVYNCLFACLSLCRLVCLSAGLSVFLPVYPVFISSPSPTCPSSCCLLLKE